MPVNNNQYIVVNIWTSEENKAWRGANCGHVSLTINDGVNEDTYVSFWPRQLKSEPTGFFEEKIRKIEKAFFKDFMKRSPQFRATYEEDCFSEALSEKAIRSIRDISECRPGETAYLINLKQFGFQRLTTQPRGMLPEQQLVAVRLIPANFRVVLYSLTVKDIVSEVERLSKPGAILGWTMAGSNSFTRTIFDNTSENCASVVYRCLNKGGLYSQVSSTLSLKPSSAVSPDDLLRIIVAKKMYESQLYTGNPEEWKVPEIDETSMDTISQAYNLIGENANAEDDIIPGIKPSVGGCSIL